MNTTMSRSQASTSRNTLITSAVLVLASTLTAQAQPIVDLGLLPGAAFTQVRAISLDGTTPVGDSAYLGFRWTEAAGIQSIGVLLGGAGSMARAVNADGTAVAGFNSSSAGYRAIRWSTTDGNRNLGVLPGGTSSDGKGISGDGSVVVGFSAGGPTGTKAVRWTLATGMVNLGTLPGGTTSIAYGISNDGTVIVGQSGATGGGRAFRWTSAGGMTSLGVLPGSTSSTGLGVSADGSTAFGYCGPAAAAIPFRHTATDGMTTPGIPAGATAAQANSSSADGRTLILDVQHAANGQRPYIWSPPAEPVDLNSYLAATGIDMSGWVLRTAFLSGDGATVSGFGDHLGVGRSYIIRGFGCANLPVVVTQPNSVTTCDGGTATFTVAVTGTGLNYRWQSLSAAMGAVDLTDGPMPGGTATVSGSASDTLVISKVDANSQLFTYRCVITNACDAASSVEVSLTATANCSVADLPLAGNCPDGVVDGSNFIAFINSFAVSDVTIDALADVAGGGTNGDLPDGIVDGNDFVAFINAFAVGC